MSSWTAPASSSTARRRAPGDRVAGRDDRARRSAGVQPLSLSRSCSVEERFTRMCGQVGETLRHGPWCNRALLPSVVPGWVVPRPEVCARHHTGTAMFVCLWLFLMVVSRLVVWICRRCCSPTSGVCDGCSSARTGGRGECCGSPATQLLLQSRAFIQSTNRCM